MRLRDLQPLFLAHREVDGEIHAVDARSRQAAEGLGFLCPKCRGGREEHLVIAWTEAGLTPYSRALVDGRFEISGDTFMDLTLTPLYPETVDSLRSRSGCGWRGLLMAGVVTTL
jgi:hypothetical protein